MLAKGAPDVSSLLIVNQVDGTSVDPAYSNR